MAKVLMHRRGSNLLYPDPTRDGLKVWYDLAGKRNTDNDRNIVKDLSGNNNDAELHNFNFTEESGYKSNELVFDGVDDKLIIPELELDETAMTVMHDGKLYAYEDDKVLSVGEDGEIVGGSENLIATPKDTYSEIASRTYRVKNGVAYWTQRTSSSGGSLPLETYASDLESDMTFSFKTNNDKNIRYYANSRASGTKFVTGTAVKENDYFVVSMVLPKFIASPTIFFYGTNPLDPVSEVKFWDFSLVRGNILPKEYSPAPSDYKKTTLTPTSLTELQLYNKTLRKDELLHNAESKGLKKLKPGVVVQDGLVLHYDFSYEINTSEYKEKAFDYSGNGNHGELQNFNFTEESGYESKRLKFDGVDDGIRQNITPSLRINEDITLESFLTFNQPHDKTDHYGWDWYIMCGNNQNVAEGFGLAREANGSLSFKYGGVNLVTDYNPEPDVTHHLLAKFDGNRSELSFYLDGRRISQSIRTDINPQIPKRTLGIGYATYYSSPRAAVSIGSVKIYNRALTTEEIAHNYAIEKEKFDITEGEI